MTVKVKVATPELPAERPKVTTGAIRSPPTTDVEVEVDVVDEELVVEVEDVEDVEDEEDEVNDHDDPRGGGGGDGDGAW